ncbi:DUF5693 family protein [Paenibacillus camelliae]|uniref:DUF5693 family protein n=1 Tax=Paenibacillus camelliae TaxID=512410 RepID=UPI00203D4B24|nr:DUF5693 family protein [Paenibacillus camelliae]
MRWKQWNKKARTLLWIITLIGVLAALPLAFLRVEMEQSADTVEYVFDYRDLEEIANYQSNVSQFIDEKLLALKDAGVQSMSLYESSLRDLMQSGRLVYYSEKEMASLLSKVLDTNVNHTYVVFTGEHEAEMIKPIIEREYERQGVNVTDWTYEGKPALIIEEAVNAATLKTLDFDPIAVEKLSSYGFQIIARFSDRVQPYNMDMAEQQIKRLSEYGVTRIIFDGSKAKGATDQAELKSLNHFGALLKQHGMGVAAIENLKVPQAGMSTLSYLLDYDVVRLYSLSENDSFTMTAEGMTDRFKLAAKDRNIRMFFLNVGIKANGNTGVLEHSADKLIETLSGEEGVIAQMEKAGYPDGMASAFQYENPSWTKLVRMIVALAAVAFITLLVGAFLPGTEIIVFVLGLLGSAGLYVLNSSLMEQALALGAAISGPTLGVIWMLNRIYSRTIGERRMLGNTNWTLSGTTPIHDGTVETDRWIFPELPLSRRLGLTLNWFIVGTIITLCAVPIVFGLLFNITYSLVIEQFRGVSLLHLGPIALVAIYVLLYRGQGAKGSITRLWKLLMTPISLLWVVVAVIVAAVGAYYLSRTGNSGQVSAIEMMIRQWLETTVGVRPRFKEFMLGHPPLILGLFLALRYRASWLLLIVGTLGQLTMVSTFTHIHTPIMMSTLRTLLGLGIGIIFGLVLIAIWTVLEGVWRKWVWPKLQQRFE